MAAHSKNGAAVSVFYFGWILLLCHHSASAYQRGKVMAFFQNSCATAAPNPCQQLCVDIRSGGFYCQCEEGYVINKDGMTCRAESHNSVESVISSASESVVHPGEELTGKSHTQGANYSQSVHSVDSNTDDNVVNIKSVDMKKGFPPLQSDAHRRLKTDSSVVLNHELYNIPEGGSDDLSADLSFDYLNIPEGGEHKESNSAPQKEVLSNPDEGMACDKVVCMNNGSCTVMESRVVCLCPLGTEGDYCERVSTTEIRYPKFGGTGYLSLPVLHNSHKEFHVNIEFRPESPNGLLLFSAELVDAKADFFSVVLDDGFIVYRFDCGTGQAVLKTPNRVKLAAWNRLTIARLDTHGSVQLNGGLEVKGNSQGNYTRITFRLNLYLGGYSNMTAISSRVATSHQFVGCIQELVINQHRFDFRKKGLVGESEFGVNVGECSEHVCDTVTCNNGGTCIAKSADQHVCLCPLGFHGESCLKDSLVHIPHFSGHSYLEFPGLERSVLSYTEIEIVFKPTSPDGTLLYNGFSRDRKGDFISLAMHDGHLEFRFDLGTGPAVIRSLKPLAIDVWHVVRASRTGLMGTLDIDGQVQQTGQAEGAYTQLTLMDNLYIGGHPNYDHTSSHANATKSFSGCIQKAVINKQTINLMGNAVTGVNISPCPHPCTGGPCLNGGECRPHLDEYSCACPIGFTDTNCEDVMEHLPTIPMFRQDSYLVYTDKEITKRVSGSRMDLQVYIRPRGHDGLLFWSGEDMRSKSSRDFIAIGFHTGILQLRYNLGSGEAQLSYNASQLFDGQWHFIRFQRSKQDAYMEIDQKEIVEGSSPGQYTFLNTNKVVYLGGMPDIAEKTGGRFTVGYDGCVRDLKLATDYNVHLLKQTHTGRNIDHCPAHGFS